MDVNIRGRRTEIYGMTTRNILGKSLPKQLIFVKRFYIHEIDQDSLVQAVVDTLLFRFVMLPAPYNTDTFERNQKFSVF